MSLAGILAAGAVYFKRQILISLSNLRGGPQTRTLNYSPDILNGYLLLGEPTARVKAVVFFDYRCPSCEGVLSELPKFYSKHQGEVCFLLRNFPIVASHPDAYELAVLFEISKPRKLYESAMSLKRKMAFDFTPQMLKKLIQKQGLISIAEIEAATTIVERDLAMAKRLDLLITPSIIVCRDGEADLVGEYLDIERYL